MLRAQIASIMKKKPIGHSCPSGWGSDKKRGYIELHPTEQTIQVIVDQNEGTVKIMGFLKSLNKNAENSYTFKFE